MIKPDDIHTRITPQERATEVRCALHLTVQRFCVPRDSAAQEYTERTNKAEIWHALYGDLERKLEELRHTVLSQMPLHGNFHGANQAISEVMALVRNPF